MNAVAVARELLEFTREPAPLVIGLPPDQPPPYTIIAKDSLALVCTALIAAEERARRLHEALRKVTEDMDRSGGDRDGMPECPWCRSGPKGEDHSPDCELLAARAVLAAPLSDAPD